MTTFAVTGAAGFIGWHISVELRALGHEVLPITRADAADPDRYGEIVGSSDIVVHAAGVNRADTDDEVRAGNLEAADQLAAALDAAPKRPRLLVYLNSTQSAGDSPYGRAKAEAGDVLGRCCEQLAIGSLDLVLPHVFGEFGRPNYNSAVATFADDLANGRASQANPDGRVELVHPRQIVEAIRRAVDEGSTGVQRLEGADLQVPVLYDRMAWLHARYVEDHTVPEVDDPLDLRLFNTIRAALFVNGHYPQPLVQHRDERGWFSELVRADALGQTSFSATAPGITRGDHFHLDKIERFIVVQGEAELRIRRMLTDTISTFELSGTRLEIVDIPTLCTHNIVNVGEGEMLTLFWAGDHFDPAHPDTYAEPVGAP